MRKLSNLLFALVLFPLCVFGIHPILEEANGLYRSGRFEEAYKVYARYLFHFPGQNWEDYYVALIGRNSCSYHLDQYTMFYIDRSFFANLIDAELPGDLTEKLGYILQSSVYWDAQTSK